MNPARSLLARALLALGLMAGFYLLALGLAAGLLALPYLEWRTLHRVHGQVALFCVVGAGVILWSIVPRRERFVAPGPELVRDAHPELFAEIEAIARATEQPMPEEVYLVGDVNAWVGRRGGFLGRGGRRTMGLGLPLLRALTVTQLRAVVAHEFGHFHGGDTRLGPWIHATRAAIGRTLRGLAEHGSILQRPFIWYGRLFLRVSHAVSRAQEHTADALAARVAGGRSLAGGLRAVHGAAAAFPVYWAHEVVPVLNAGRVPPVAEGFARFLGVEGVARRTRELVERELREGQADPYDTHPPLRERIAALGEPSAEAAPDADPPACSLLRGPRQLERELLGFLGDRVALSGMADVAWEEVGSTVFAPLWAEAVRRNREAFAAHTAASVAAAAADPRAFESALRDRVPPERSAEERRGQALWHLGAGLAHALGSAGWRAESLPGEPIRFARGDEVLAPFEIVDALADGKLGAAAWRERCERLGIAGLPLAG